MKISSTLRQSAKRIKLFLCEVDGEMIGLRPEERQRRSVFQPRVGAQRLPWVNVPNISSTLKEISAKVFEQSW